MPLWALDFPLFCAGLLILVIIAIAAWVVDRIRLNRIMRGRRRFR